MKNRQSVDSLITLKWNYLSGWWFQPRLTLDLDRFSSGMPVLKKLL